MEKRLGKGKIKWETEEKRQGETGKVEGETERKDRVRKEERQDKRRRKREKKRERSTHGRKEMNRREDGAKNETKRVGDEREGNFSKLKC